MTKTTQLQIRVSPQEKSRLQAAARAANVSVSEWMLSCALASGETQFQALTAALPESKGASHALAALHDFIHGLPPIALVDAVAHPPQASLTEFERAYVAAMVELACHRARKPIPEWVRATGPLTEPYFATQLVTLRAHLLRSSPPPFRKRNIFIDATLGDRV